MSQNYYLRFDANQSIRETPKARLFIVEGEEIWIPKSQISHFAVEGDTVAVTVSDWIFKVKDLERFVDPEWVALGCP